MSMRAGMGSWDEADEPNLPRRKQYGAVIVFKHGANKAAIKDALTKIGALLEHQPTVHEFDPSYGGPVWYIP